MDPITSLLIGLALQVGVGLLRSIFAKPAPKPDQRQSGIRQQLAIGGDEPLSFIMGRYGTAGYLEYVGTWGEVDDVPNAYLTMVISVSDLPVRGLVKLFVNGEDVTIGASHNAKGYPVTIPGDGGTRHMWIEFFDGTQTTADSFLLDKFPSGNRAWQSDMIGRGIAYARITTLFNRELFNGIPEFYFTIDGIELDDPRGGNEGQANPIVMAHQTLSGIYFGDEWVWGLQGLPATRLPASIQDEMDKCDVLVDQKGGGTEKRFRAGAEIRVDQQPIEVIPELLETCNGRVAEIGGIYKFLVAEPAAAVVSFTDEDIVITETQSFAPFPGLEATFNAINSTYVEPDERWAVKSAPQLRDASLEADDDDRLLPASVSNPFVFSATQRQRLDSALLEEHRRFRSHAMTMPPEWWEYEVLDVAQWTSGRNGYIGKDGLITMMDDLPNGNQFVGWKEQDPDVYDWDPDADEQDYDVVPLLIERPAAQVATGYQLFPDTIDDNDGTPRRPTFGVQYPGQMVDVRAIGFEVKLDGHADDDLIVTGDFPYGSPGLNPATKYTRINNVFAPNTALQAHFKELPFSGRVTEFGSWLSVTTPDIGIDPSELPPIEVQMLGHELFNAYGMVTTDDPAAYPAIIAALIAKQNELALAQIDNNATTKQILKVLTAQHNGANAAIITNQEAIVTETEARAAAITEAIATFSSAISSWDGTMTATNGSNVLVVVSGPALTTENCKPGAAVTLDGVPYSIDSLANASHCVLAVPYFGATGVVTASIVLPTPDATLADGYLEIEATANETEGVAVITGKVRARAGDTTSQAGMMIKAQADFAGGTIQQFGVLGTFYIFRSELDDGIPIFSVDGDGNVHAFSLTFDDVIKSSATSAGVPVIYLDGLTGDFSFGRA